MKKFKQHCLLTVLNQYVSDTAFASLGVDPPPPSIVIKVVITTCEALLQSLFCNSTIKSKTAQMYVQEEHMQHT